MQTLAPSSGPTLGLGPIIWVQQALWVILMQAEVQELMHETLLRAVVFKLWHGSASLPSPNFLPNYKLFCFVFSVFLELYISSLPFCCFFTFAWLLLDQSLLLTIYDQLSSLIPFHTLNCSPPVTKSEIALLLQDKSMNLSKVLGSGKDFIQLTHGCRRWKAGTSK